MRKTFRIGPLRLNLYGSSISVSAGAGPARVVYKLLGAQQGKATLYAFGAPIKSQQLGQEQRPDAIPEPTLEELLRYTRLEFDEEERRLSTKPRLYALHCRQHNELYDTIAAMSPDEALPYLQSWWEGHKLYRSAKPTRNRM